MMTFTSIFAPYYAASDTNNELLIAVENKPGQNFDQVIRYCKSSEKHPSIIVHNSGLHLELDLICLFDEYTKEIHVISAIHQLFEMDSGSIHHCCPFLTL